MSRTRPAALLACALVLGAVAVPVPSASAQDSESTQRRLERTRAEFEAIAAQRRKLESERGAAVRALRDADERLGETSRKLATIERQVAEREATMTQLQARRVELTDRLGRQREALAVLLRAAHALGEHAPLKLLLAQDRVADGQRLLAYHGYLQRERARRIDQLAAELQGLATLEARIESERVALQAARTAQRKQLELLEHDRKARAGTLAQLEGRYRDRATREKALGRDVKSLERLLSQLREAAARAERERAAARAKAQAEAEARARAPAASATPGAPAPAPPPVATPAPIAASGGIKVGGLGWPAAGTLLAGFGARMPDGRRSDGVLIGAGAGSEVTAAAPGRVVFADWMNGYGLILIVDHGDDTMSLYAHNEALLRNVGDTVARGEPVARVGSSGGQGQPALYFELRRNGAPVDPRTWLQRR